MKTVRFASVVEKAGHPEAYTLWVAPDKDAHFQAALKAHRVMTVHQETRGGKKDYGEVGFQKEGNLLVFPKSVKRFEGARIVGIKYDLLEAEEPASAAEAKSEKRPNIEKPEAKKPRAEPKQKKERNTASFPPLRVFEPEQEEEQEKRPKRVAPEKEPEPKHEPRVEAKEEPPDTAEELKGLQREVRRAMKKLESGNTVGAYQILERAMG